MKKLNIRDFLVNFSYLSQLELVSLDDRQDDRLTTKYNCGDANEVL